MGQTHASPPLHPPPPTHRPGHCRVNLGEGGSYATLSARPDSTSTSARPPASGATKPPATGPSCPATGTTWSAAEEEPGPAATLPPPPPRGPAVVGPPVLLEGGAALPAPPPPREGASERARPPPGSGTSVTLSHSHAGLPGRRRSPGHRGSGPPGHGHGASHCQRMQAQFDRSSQWLRGSRLGREAASVKVPVPRDST